MEMSTAKLIALIKSISGEGGGGGDSFAPDITNPQDGDTLVYNAAQQKWVNGAGAGGVLVVGATMSDGTITLNKTAGEIIEASKAGLVLLPNNFSGDSVGVFYLSTVYGRADGSQYDIWFANLSDATDNIEYTCFIATAKNDYPTASIE